MFDLSKLKTFADDKFKAAVMMIFACVNRFPNKPWFLGVWSTSLLKTLWEKEKLLVMTISPFPTVFSTLIGNFTPFSSNSKLSSAKSFSLEESKICRLGKELTNYQTTKF